LYGATYSATNTFEEALVVEATITNELKKAGNKKFQRHIKFWRKMTNIRSRCRSSSLDNTGNKFEFEEQLCLYFYIRV
jgi:hypothetical protein